MGEEKEEEELVLAAWEKKRRQISSSFSTPCSSFEMLGWSRDSQCSLRELCVLVSHLLRYQTS